MPDLGSGMNIHGTESLLYLNICVPSKFGCFCILCCFDFWGVFLCVCVFFLEGGLLLFSGGRVGMKCMIVYCKVHNSL